MTDTEIQTMKPLVDMSDIENVKVLDLSEFLK